MPFDSAWSRASVQGGDGETGPSRGTNSHIFRRLKLSCARDLKPAPPTQRYEHAAEGDLLHLDIKKLGRIMRLSHRVTGNRRDSGEGWEYVRVAIGDHSRMAFSAIYADENRSTLGFLHAALAYSGWRGITLKAVLTDNGPADRSRAFARHRA